VEALAADYEGHAIIGKLDIEVNVRADSTFVVFQRYSYLKTGS
jgi:hypothetical protein